MSSDIAQIKRDDIALVVKSEMAKTGLWPVVNDDSVVFGAGSPMDSLKLMGYLLAVERKLAAIGVEFNFSKHTLDLVEQQGFSGAQKLADFICSKCNIAENIEEPKKAVFVDLDGTMWDGVLLEDGEVKRKVNTRLESQLAELQRKGVLLVVVSHANEERARAAIRESCKVLNESQIVSWKCGYRQKGEYFQEALRELNILPKSVVFVDDSEYERDLIGSMYPDIVCVLPDVDLAKYFNFSVVTEEDLRRTEMIMQDKERQKYLESMSMEEFVNHYDAWLESLNTTVYIEPISNKNIHRCLELLNKTNQFNLSLRRYTELAFIDLLETYGIAGWAFRVVDKFGDMGIVGVAITNGDVLEEFCLSCRSFGRDIEQVMVNCFSGGFIANLDKSKENLPNDVARKFFENLQIGAKPRGNPRVIWSD